MTHDHGYADRMGIWPLPAAPSAQPDEGLADEHRAASAAAAHAASDGQYGTPAQPDEVRAEPFRTGMCRAEQHGACARQRISERCACTCHRPAAPSAQPDEVRVDLPSGGCAHVASDAPPSLLRAIDALSHAAQQDTLAQPDERRCTCDTWNRWSNNHSMGCPVLLTTEPAQPVRDTGEGR